MKKGLLFVAIVAASVLASAKTFVDKTNLDQLNYRVLESGQFAWTEEDGSAVIYVGSPTEVKNLRVTDPTALRGFRYKTINEELTFNACDLFTSTVVASNNANVFTYTSNSSRDNSYKSTKYKDLGDTGAGYAVTNNTIKVEFRTVTGVYVHNSDGSYTPISLPDGSYVGGTNQLAGVQYAYQYEYIPLSIEVISKETNIEEIDFEYSQTEGGLNDMNPIETERRIIYDGRHATIELDVVWTSGNNKYCRLSNFTTKCRGIGDVELVNDLTQNKIYIYDKLLSEEGKHSGRPRRDQWGNMHSNDTPYFDLSDLRYWTKHLYDGNRGEHWANYVALNHIHTSNRWIRTTSDWFSQGPMSTNMYAFAHKGVEYMTFAADEGSGSQHASQYAGIQIAFTAINAGTDETSLDIVIDVPAGKTRPPMDTFLVQWKDDLRDPVWTPINCVWTQTDGAGLEWHIEVPSVYAQPLNKTGFYRIYLRSDPYASTLKIQAELQVMGSDGYMYKLSWPQGGGTVTATLVD